MLWSEVPACQGQTRKSRIAIEFEFAYHARPEIEVCAGFV